MTYRYVATGPITRPFYKVIWKGALSKPIASCDDARDARRICEALNVQNNFTTEETESTKAAVLKWIRVEDRLPDADLLVLAYLEESGQMVMAAFGEDDWYADDSILIKRGITHWCDPVPPTA